VWLEPGSLERRAEALDHLGCAFVGMAPRGLSYLKDRRPRVASRSGGACPRTAPVKMSWPSGGSWRSSAAPEYFPLAQCTWNHLQG
jgi:hypothetical protein